MAVQQLWNPKLEKPSQQGKLMNATSTPKPTTTSNY